MASEIRVDKINSLSGVGTVTLSPTGVDIAGITTAATLRATTGIVTSLTSGSLTSLGAVSGTTGTFTSSLTINTTTDQMLNLNSTDDGGTYIGYQRSGTRTAYLGHGGTGGTFSLRNEIQDGYVTITGNDGGSYIDMISLATSSNGDATFSGNLIIPDKIVHSGDTNTAIRFSDADTISFETGGSARAKITSTGNFEMPNDNDYIKIGAGGDLQLVHSGSASFITNSTGFLEIQSATITLENASGTERARVDSSGNFLVGGTSLGAADSFGVQPSGHFRHIGASGSTGDTLLGAIDGVSNGFQVNISGTNVQKYKFHNGSTQTVQIDSDGLKFMNDTAAANALDDYEEGTFTMHFSVEGQSNMTMSGRVGIYTKIGRVVHIIGGGQVAENPPGGRSTSAAIQFTNLPFTSKQLNTGTAGLPFSVNTQGLDSTGLGQLAGSQPYQFNGRLFDNSTNGRIIAYKGDGDQNPQNASLALVYNSQIYVMFSYVTDS